MKAMVIEEFGGPEKLHLKELKTPEPGPGEVRIRVAYAGVNPVDVKMCQGYLKDRLPNHFPLIPGWDAAGTIDAVGPNVEPSRIGEKVYAYVRKPVVQWGTYAEYVTFDGRHVVPAPKKVSLKEASVIPLATLTAWQSIVEWGQVSKGQTVLIHAGAGGVGGMAVQLAHHFGARVITTTSKGHFPYVKQLGADVIVDYTKEKVTEKADLVFDTVGGQVFDECWNQVKPGGKLVSILHQPDPKRAAQHSVQNHYVFVRPEGEQLRQIAQLLDSGAIKPPKITEFELKDAAKAFALQGRGHVEGKLALKVT